MYRTTVITAVKDRWKLKCSPQIFPFTSLNTTGSYICACMYAPAYILVEEINRRKRGNTQLLLNEKCQCSRYKSEQYSLWLCCVMNSTTVRAGVGSICGLKNIEFSSECSHRSWLHLRYQQLSKQIINVSNKTNY